MSMFKQLKGWHVVAKLPKEYQFRRNNKKKLKALEEYLSIKDGRTFYDFRVNVDTWDIWLKKKDIYVNTVTSR